MLVATMMIIAAINGGLYLGTIAYSNFENSNNFEKIYVEIKDQAK